MKRCLNLIVIIIFSICLFVTSKANAQTQNQRKITIGLALWGINPAYKKNIDGFKDALTQAGFVEGQNTKYIIKISKAGFDVQVKNIESLVEDKVDLIYSITTSETLVAKSVTKNIPIVFSIVSFPLESGLINSLISSGNNLTGTRNYIPAARQYFFFEKIFPHTKTLAFVHRKGESNSTIQFNEFKEVLAKRKIDIIDVAALDLDDMRGQLEAVSERVDSYYAACDTLVQVGGQDIIIDVSRKNKKPFFTCLHDGVTKGVLMGNVADFYQIGKKSGQKAALILNGLQPSQIITESPQEDYIVVNLASASELGLTVPEDIMKKAKEIIK